MYANSHDTFETTQARLDELKKVEAELLQPDYQQPRTEQQLELQLRG
ncbi:MAG: hypothetical protein V3R25_10155 [Nitrosomonadaceae bacterium]